MKNSYKPKVQISKDVLQRVPPTFDPYTEARLIKTQQTIHVSLPWLPPLLFWKTIFIYFWLCWVVVAESAFLCSRWGPLPHLGTWASHAVAFLVAEHGLLGPWALGLQWLRLLGLVLPRHVGSSRIRDQTRVSCIGRWILYH